ncbi:hypothetical protein HW115_05715 [Verrucomicrobiaceae bacterium N1E253]|uniref:Uncharacterized protein n=1 Tax=Oceaniferula marina TaxID=2748318 RepID=A0A851GJ04_9BACT|nr:hypothetical protein [Oceaniferula marina]NWK55097.1 hypothetical protein [Oceaniferula marina]
MKNTILLAILCLALGFSAGWLAKPATTTAPPEEDPAPVTRANKKASPKSVATTPDTRPRTRSSVEVYSSDDELDEETKQQINEAQSRQQKMVRDQLKKKFDLKIAAMVEELGLDAEQEKALRDFFEQQLDVLSESNPMEMASDPEAMKKLAAAMRGDGLNEHMANHLSEEQIDKLEAFETRQKKNKTEGMAMKDLAKIQQALDLSEEQRDAVYGILVEDAAKNLENQSDTTVVMDGMMKSMGMEMDLGDMDFDGLMQLDPAQNNGEPIDQSSVIAKMKEDRTKKIDAKVERMAPVLNENQLKQYRSHLESKGGLFNMMIQGMEQ